MTRPCPSTAIESTSAVRSDSRRGVEENAGERSRPVSTRSPEANLLQGFRADEVVPDERHLVARKTTQRLGQGLESRGCLASDRGGEGVRLAGRLEDAVHDEPQARDPEGEELRAGPLGLRDRAALGAGDEDDRRARSVLEGSHGRRVERPLLAQRGEGSDAARTSLVRAEESLPGGRERKETKRVSRRRRVENDVVVCGGGRLVAEEPGEPVERGDLDGARTRELLFHPCYGIRGKDRAERPDDPFAVFLRRDLGVDVERVESRNAGNGARFSRQPDAEDLVEVRSGVGADEEDAEAPVGKRHGARAGERSLSDAPFPVKRRKRVGASRSRRPVGGRARISATGARSFARAAAGRRREQERGRLSLRRRVR